MAVKIQVRRGTATEWTAANPVLMEGELGVELDTGLWKVGNGLDEWNTLGYAYGPGLKGDTGDTGSQGNPGIDGATWHSGSADPATGLGAVNDFYLNTTSADVFKKTGTTTWTLQGNIRGEQGIQGAKGVPGEDGAVWYNGIIAPASGTGAVGDYYLDTVTGDVYEKTGATTWTLSGNIRGPQGEQGIQGATGATGATGSQGPQGIQGETGATGATGIAGATWYSGISDPAGGTGVVNDYYLNTTTYDVFKKTGASTWTVQCNIRGAQGIQGEQGIQGVQGETGATGPQGIQGIQGDQGIQGVPGADGADGVGIPEGGTTGQLLAKATGTNYDTTWTDGYAHPANHPASIITQDSSNRFVTDAEKTTWNNSGQNLVSHMNDYMSHDSELSSYAGGIDANGIYTVVDFKRADNTLYLKSTLSNADVAGNYQLATWQFYQTNGTTLALTKTWVITYDANGMTVTKVVS